jgi:hypothetical protein
MSEDILIIPDDFVAMKVKFAGGKAEFFDDKITLSSPSGKYTVDFERPATPEHLEAALSILHRIALEAA